MKYIYNGKLRTEDWELKELARKSGIYEVIRVIDGVPMFAAEHLRRLEQSSRLMSLDMRCSKEDIMLSICQLSHINDIKEKNIKILFCDDGDYVYFFIDSFYPDEEMYAQGVKLVSYEARRSNPNAKFHDPELRSLINEYIAERGAYEALLVDDDMEIKEGSRSNIFFIKDGELITAPGNRVLMGITREKVLSIATDLEIPLREERLFYSDLAEMDGAFMTSTSNSVLPISQIDDHQFAVGGEVIDKLMNKFAELKSKDLARAGKICQAVVKIIGNEYE